MAGRAPYGSERRGPTRRVTRTPTAITWCCRCKDGETDHSMCVSCMICIEMTTFKSNYADKNKQFIGINHCAVPPAPQDICFFNRLQVLKKEIPMLICQNSLRGSQIVANGKVVFLKVCFW